MSCCGHRPWRPDGASGGTVHGSPVAGAGLPTPGTTDNTDTPGHRAGHPEFRYTGATTLTVTGPVTGRTYRFAAPGARLEVNRHDAASLLYVPSLQPVRR